MSIISTSIKSEFSAAVQALYDDLKKEIIVHKEPIKVIVDVTSNPYGGYGESSNINNYSLIPVSGIFMVGVRHDSPMTQNPEQPIRQLDFRIPRGGAVIECMKDCRDYILNGKTERIDVDEKSFNIVSNWGVHDYLGLKFYYFTLEGTT